MIRKDSGAALSFIFITVLIDTIGFGIVLPVIPNLLIELTHVDVSQASIYGGWLAFAYAIMQFIFGPIIGNLSDRFGRRPVLLLSLLAFGIDYPTVKLLAAVHFIWTLGHQVLPATWAFYTQQKFGWSPTEIGFSLAFAGVLMAAVQAGLTRVLIPRIGERVAVLIGLTAGGIGYLGYAFAWSGWMLYPVMVVGMLAGLTFPSLNALMSQCIPKTSQGELQGAVASIFSLTTIIGPVMMTQLFGYFTSPQAPIQFPGAAFIFAAFLTLIGLILFARAAGTLAPQAATDDQPSAELAGVKPVTLGEG